MAPVLVKHLKKNRHKVCHSLRKEEMKKVTNYSTKNLVGTTSTRKAANTAAEAEGRKKYLTLNQQAQELRTNRL
jgi:hypothetical protein